MSNRLYDVLKYVAMIGLPAAATLYASLAATWNLAYSDEITVSIVALNTFLGALIGLNSRSYNSNSNTHKKEIRDGE